MCSPRLSGGGGDWPGCLVTRCLEEARERGISQVGLSTTEPARSLYERLGFRPSNTEMRLTDQPDGWTNDTPRRKR